MDDEFKPGDVLMEGEITRTTVSPDGMEVTVEFTADTSRFHAAMEAASRAVEVRQRWYQALRARIISALFGMPPPSPN